MISSNLNLKTLPIWPVVSWVAIICFVAGFGWSIWLWFPRSPTMIWHGNGANDALALSLDGTLLATMSGPSDERVMDLPGSSLNRASVTANAHVQIRRLPDGAVVQNLSVSGLCRQPIPTGHMRS